MAQEAVANGTGNDLGEDGEVGAWPKVRELSGKRLAPFIILPALLLGAGAGAYFMGVLGHSPGQEPVKAKAEDSGHAVSPAGLTYELPDMLVELNGGGTSNILRISVALEVEGEAALERLHTVMPRVLENCQVHVSALDIEDLSGPAGLDRLRDELLLRVNAAIRPAKVRDVTFMEMLVQ